MYERRVLPIVVVDIDNTVADHFNRIKGLYGADISSVPYDLANSEEVVLSFKVIEGAIESIGEISRKYQIFWLTARKPHLIEVTENWLRIHGFEIDKLIFVNLYEEKLSHLLTINPVLFIDDLKYDYYSLKPKPATIMMEKLNKHNIPFVAFDNNWKEILSILM